MSGPTGPNLLYNSAGFSGSSGWTAYSGTSYVSEYKFRPWIDLKVDYSDVWWNYNDNILYAGQIPSESTPIAYFVIQDCNMASTYYRYFMWYEGDNIRYCKISSEWIFDKTIYTIKKGDKFKDKNEREWICVSNFDNIYIKIFEKISKN